MRSLYVENAHGEKLWSKFSSIIQTFQLRTKKKKIKGVENECLLKQNNNLTYTFTLETIISLPEK